MQTNKVGGLFFLIPVVIFLIGYLFHQYHEFFLPLIAFMLGAWLLFEVKDELKTGILRLRGGGRVYRKKYPYQFLIGIVIQSVVAIIFIIYSLIIFLFDWCFLFLAI